MGKKKKRRDCTNYVVRVASKEEDMKILSAFIDRCGDSYFTWLVKTMSDLRKKATVPEITVARYLFSNRVKFITQTPFRIFRENEGFHTFFADFYIPALNLVIEIDGNQHGEPKQLLYDIHRDNDFANIGIRTLRIKNRDVYNGKFKFIIPIPSEEHLIPQKITIIPEGVSGLTRAKRVAQIEKFMKYKR